MTLAPWVTVELHNSTSPYAMIDSNSAILSTSGTGTFTFSKAVNGTSYFIVIKSMNTIETWSSAAHSFTGSQLSYNFTSSINQAYTDGSNPPMALHNGKWCIYTGDLNHDGFVSGDDFTGVDNDNSAFGYHFINDLDGDGFVGGNDFTFINNNNELSIHRQLPAGATGN
jgi:hypothetical protein